MNKLVAQLRTDGSVAIDIRLPLTRCVVLGVECFYIVALMYLPISESSPADADRPLRGALP